MSNYSEKKLFYIFLMIHFTVWTLISLIRAVLPTDALEGIYWGSLHDFGTPKHPPMSGWLCYLSFLPFKKDICVYLLSQGFILAGFIYIYKLAKCFLGELESMLSVIILEGCWVYSYITCYYGFNPDVILLFTLPCISYYFCRTMREDKNSDWIKLGFVVGFSFLNKYQTLFLIIPMAIWVILYKKETFKNKYFYLSVLIAFLMFLPHLIWLFEYDFFPFTYFEEELSANTFLCHITKPLTFLVVQFSLIAGSVLIYLIFKKVFKSPFKLIENIKKEDAAFILLLGLFPFAAHFIMGTIFGGTMRPRWGFEFWFMTGIMLFYFFPSKTEKKEFVFILKSSYVVMTIIAVVMGSLLAFEKNYRSRYPVQKIYNDMNKIWSEQYKTPLKYLGGYIEWTLPLSIYGKSHPQVLLDTNGYKSPWIDEEDMKKSGCLVIDRTVYELTKDTYGALPPSMLAMYQFKPVKYKFKVKNAFNKEREYTVFYTIVPPLKEENNE